MKDGSMRHAPHSGLFDPRCSSAADRPLIRRALPRALILVPVLLLGRPWRPVIAASAPITLSGKVCAAPGDRPAPHAFVGVNGVGTEADAAGSYTIQVPAASRLFVEVDARGYQSDGAFTVSGPGGALLTGRVGFSFCGSAALHGAFSSAGGQVRLTPFATTLPVGATGLAIGGRSAIPLEDNAAVTRPDGRASLIPLTRRGAAFGLTLPFAAGPGRYLIEINAATGFAALKMAIFRGPYVPPAPPPRYVGDRRGATIEALRSAALAGLNRYRALVGLPPLRRERRHHRGRLPEPACPYRLGRLGPRHAGQSCRGPVRRSGGGRGDGRLGAGGAGRTDGLAGASLGDPRQLCPGRNRGAAAGPLTGDHCGFRQLASFCW